MAYDEVADVTGAAILPECVATTEIQEGERDFKHRYKLKIGWCLSAKSGRCLIRSSANSEGLDEVKAGER